MPPVRRQHAALATGGAPMRSSSQPPRWQDDGLSISFRSCQLQGLVSLHDALATAQNGGQPVVPSDVMHLDVAENEVELTPSPPRRVSRDWGSIQIERTR